MCRPADFPPYPEAEPGTGSMVHGPEGHTCYHCGRPARHGDACPWNLDRPHGLDAHSIPDDLDREERYMHRTQDQNHSTPEE